MFVTAFFRNYPASYPRAYSFEAYTELQDFFGENLEFPTYYPKGFDPNNADTDIAWTASASCDDKKDNIPKSSYYQEAGFVAQREIDKSKNGYLYLMRVNLLFQQSKSEEWMIEEQHYSNNYTISLQETLRNELHNQQNDGIKRLNYTIAEANGNCYSIDFGFYISTELTQAQYDELSAQLKEEYTFEAIKMYDSLEVWK